METTTATPNQTRTATPKPTAADWAALGAVFGVIVAGVAGIVLAVSGPGRRMGAAYLKAEANQARQSEKFYKGLARAIK